MEFLEKLIARPLVSSPLKSGPLSGLAADARSEEWIETCAAGLDTQEARFATNLLLRALRAADFILTRLEAEQPVLAFFEGASRDVLLYEILHFCLHGMSDEFRRRVAADAPDAGIYLSDLAFVAAGELARQHIGQFDVSRHRVERARSYLRHVENQKEMTECLIGTLLCAQGRTTVDPLGELPARDFDMETQITIRGIVQAAPTICISESAEMLAANHLCDAHQLK